MALMSIPFHSDVAEVYDRLRRRALIMTRNRDRAEDLVQEALLRHLKNAARRPAGVHPEAWIGGIMRNVLRAWNRRIRWRSTDSLSEIQAPTAAPLFEETLSELLGGFPQEIALILELRASGRSIPEIAGLLGLSPSVTRKRVKCAKDRLIRRLGAARPAA
jgi:RNA polymerase sigma-70 factor (ECF subfamily)